MIRKCKAAQESLCYNCTCACPACGTKKFSVDEDCALCMYCEEQYPIKQEKEENQEIKILNVENPAVLYINGD